MSKARERSAWRHTTPMEPAKKTDITGARDADPGSGRSNEVCGGRSHGVGDGVDAPCATFLDLTTNYQLIQKKLHTEYIPALVLANFQDPVGKLEGGFVIGGDLPTGRVDIEDDGPDVRIGDGGVELSRDLVELSTKQRSWKTQCVHLRPTPFQPWCVC